MFKDMHSRQRWKWVLCHPCRSGKTWVGVRYLYGEALVGGPAMHLRPHQEQALRDLNGLALPTERRGAKRLMVFSSLAVLQQFVQDYLTPAIENEWMSIEAMGRVVALCSLSDNVRRPWFVALQGGAADPKEERLQAFLQDDDPCFFLTTYESCKRLQEALDAASDSYIDRAIFDEAHNVHTPSRYFLWGGDRTMEQEYADSISEETDGGTQEKNLQPTEEGIKQLDRQYPSRLYMTATPRLEMRLHKAVYGDCEDPHEWDTYRYIDLVKDQRDLSQYSEPCVKEFDIAVLFNGSPCADTSLKPREFWDRVSFLRSILAGGKDGPSAVKRALLFHAYANHTERAARTFAETTAWAEALEWLRVKEPHFFEATTWD